MNKFSKLFAFLFISLFFYQCKTAQVSSGNQTVTTQKESFITGYDLSIATSAKPIWCESSAILFDGQKVFMAIDKDMPGSLTSVFAWNSGDDFFAEKMPENVSTKAFKNASKYEDMALSPDGKIAFLSTAFDRVKDGSHDWDGYNTIYYWAVGQENNPQVLALQDDASNSVSLRPIFAKILSNVDFPNGMPYFKIEGFAATDNRLYFGVREEGKKFDDFKYVSKIISVSYSVTWNAGTPKIKLSDNWALVNSFVPEAAESTLLSPMGISSIEYDRFHKRFYFLTSYEKGESIGAYLWTATEEEILNQKPYTLLKDAEGKPLAFTHKAEDITVLDAHKLIVICDDDRIVTDIKGTKRQPNQAAYYVVEVK